MAERGGGTVDWRRRRGRRGGWWWRVALLHASCPTTAAVACGARVVIFSRLSALKALFLLAVVDVAGPLLASGDCCF